MQIWKKKKSVSIKILIQKPRAVNFKRKNRFIRVLISLNIIKLNTSKKTINHVKNNNNIEILLLSIAV